jgi:hypothetical protein
MSESTSASANSGKTRTSIVTARPRNFSLAIIDLSIGKELGVGMHIILLKHWVIVQHNMSQYG